MSSTMQFRRGWFFALMILLARTVAIAQTPVGSEFQVNSYTTSFQNSPVVAIHSGGDFVVVWTSGGSNGGDTSFYSVQGQRFGANANRLGTQFQVNSYTTSYQSSPAVAIDSAGDFVVAWESRGSNGGDTSSYSVQGQRFDANANRLGTQFQVNSYTTSFQNSPVVAIHSGGDFVVVWSSDGSNGGDTSSNSVQGQRVRVTGLIGDRVWQDQDFNGLQDLLEPGLQGVQIHLFDQDSILQQSTLTDARGGYAFKAKEGTYFLQFELPNTFSFTPQDVLLDDTLDSDADTSFGQTIDFTVVEATRDLTQDAGMANGVGNFAWQDLNQDGFQDGGEPGLSGVMVSLVDAATQALVAGPVATAADGRYHFNDIVPTEYYLEFTPPAGFAFTSKNQGADDLRDSDAEPITGHTGVFSFTPGLINVSWDAGFIPLATIGDLVWHDSNGDGRQQPLEEGVPGITVRLLDAADAVVASTVTAADGIYQFGGIGTGEYRLEFVLPPDTLFSNQDVGSNDLIDSDVDPTTGRTSLFAYTALGTSWSHDVGIVFVAFFADGFESGDTSAWQ